MNVIEKILIFLGIIAISLLTRLKLVKRLWKLIDPENYENQPSKLLLLFITSLAVSGIFFWTFMLINENFNPPILISLAIFVVSLVPAFIALKFGLILLARLVIVPLLALFAILFMKRRVESFFKNNSLGFIVFSAISLTLIFLFGEETIKTSILRNLKLWIPGGISLLAYARGIYGLKNVTVISGTTKNGLTMRIKLH